MEEDIRDISGESYLLDELNELTIGGKNADQKLHRSNPVFDAQRPSSKVMEKKSKFFFPFILMFCLSVRFRFAYNTDEGHRAARKGSRSITIYQRPTVV